jgi:hypothetical protein
MMRTLIAFAALVFLVSCAEIPTHPNHNWQKVSEQPLESGEKLCQWKCTSREHFITTSGYGVCPTPSMF